MGKTMTTLQRAIKADGRSDRQIALAAGISPASLCRMLTGRQVLSVDAAERLAEALGLRIVVEPSKGKKAKGQ